MSKKLKSSKKKIRDWHALNAINRNSAGPMKNKKKTKKYERRWKQRKEIDDG